MDPIIYTPQLKLTLITQMDRENPEFTWIHQLRTNEQSMWWSLGGTDKSTADTQKAAHRFLTTNNGDKLKHVVTYAVHRLLEPGAVSDGGEGAANTDSEFIGTVAVRSLGPFDPVLPDHLNAPSASAPDTLTVELAYSFLPTQWGRGYATESINAFLSACKRALGQSTSISSNSTTNNTGTISNDASTTSFWAPYTKLYVRALVNAENPASLRVMQKVGMPFRGMFEWRGEEAVFVAGKWVVEDRVHIFGETLCHAP